MKVISKIEDFPKQGKILCVDVGKKTLGIAICDKLRTLASAYPTIRRTKWGNDKKEFAKYIEENRIECFVVGWPLHPDGAKFASTDVAESFADTLADEFKLPVLLFDERYSTKMAEKTMRATGMKRKNAKGNNLDSVAASFILESFLRKAEELDDK